MNDLQLIGFREMIEDFNSLKAENMDDIGDISTYAWANRSICSLLGKETLKEVLAVVQTKSSIFTSYLAITTLNNVAGVEESQFCDYR